MLPSIKTLYTICSIDEKTYQLRLLKISHYFILLFSNYSIDQGEHVEILLSIYLNMNKTKRSIKCFLLSLDCRVKTDIAGTGGGGLRSSE